MSSTDGATRLERRIRTWGHDKVDSLPKSGIAGVLVGIAVVGLKQTWACIFGVMLLVAVIVTELSYPAEALLHRNDALVLMAVTIQVAMLVCRLESVRELMVIGCFHVAGTGMELFKTAVGSWSYETGGLLQLGIVPLYSGFMYAAVGSYLTRVVRLFDLRFTRYPPIVATVVLAAAIYVNFFSHHFLPDLRYVLLVAVAVLWGRCTVHLRLRRHIRKVPVLGAFAYVAGLIWLAENIATASGTWLYPSQVGNWHVVPLTKFVAWYLLMIVSVVLVTLVHRPRAPDLAATVSQSVTTAGRRDGRLGPGAIWALAPRSPRRPPVPWHSDPVSKM